MKSRTKAEADLAGMHPLNFIIAVSDMLDDWSECWPEVDTGFAETLASMKRTKVDYQPTTATPPTPSKEQTEPLEKLPVSEEAARILDKMERHDCWGTKSTVWDQMKNHYGKGIQDLEAVVVELKEAGLLDEHGRDQFSLETAKKPQILHIVQLFRAGKKK